MCSYLSFITSNQTPYSLILLIMWTNRPLHIFSNKSAHLPCHGNHGFSSLATHISIRFLLQQMRLVILCGGRRRLMKWLSKPLQKKKKAYKTTTLNRNSRSLSSWSLRPWSETLSHGFGGRDLIFLSPLHRTHRPSVGLLPLLVWRKITGQCEEERKWCLVGGIVELLCWVRELWDG